MNNDIIADATSLFEQLQGLPVSGVGVGEENGQSVLVVYLERSVKASEIPHEWRGFPVKTSPTCGRIKPGMVYVTSSEKVEEPETIITDLRITVPGGEREDEKLLDDAIEKFGTQHGSSALCSCLGKWLLVIAKSLNSTESTITVDGLGKITVNPL